MCVCVCICLDGFQDLDKSGTIGAAELQATMAKMDHTVRHRGYYKGYEGYLSKLS